jgi:hypothetical protein
MENLKKSSVARLMKKIIVITIAMPLFSSLLLGQKKVTRESVEETLIKMEKQSWDAWKSRDGKFYEGFLSDDHVEVGSGGGASKSEVVAFVGSPVCVVKNFSVDHFKLTIFDSNTALLTYHAQQDTTCSGRPVPSPVWVSSLYIRHGGKWLNALYEQTPAR